ncbi:MAG: sugar phosphate isomerase/epimerase [Phycisphaerae bacterium]|nr:sugar phosphate isomerase/epimerase [Phycisphaerae bacterium]
MKDYSRREALKLTALGAAVLVGGGSSTLFAAEKKAPVKPVTNVRLALQLYSVRRSCGKDIDKVLADVKKMGYVGVEFAGYYKYGKDPKALKAKLDELGLIAAGTHIGTGSFTGPNVQKTIDFHKTIGCKFLIAPGDGAFCHPERSKKLADDFNKAAETLKKADMYCGYHNHSREMKKAAGETTKSWFDLFAERTCQDVVLQQDVGWTVSAGADPAAFIRRYPGRFRIQHFKPALVRGAKDKKPIIGQDCVKWEEVIAASYEVGGAEWFTIEQEHYLKGKSDMECSEMSLVGLKAILKKMNKSCE